MSCVKNLDDIPMPFKKYTENVSGSTQEKNVNAMSHNTYEKNSQTINQQNACSMDMRDKIFVLIILMIFFDNH